MTDPLTRLSHWWLRRKAPQPQAGTLVDDRIRAHTAAVIARAAESLQLHSPSTKD